MSRWPRHLLALLVRGYQLGLSPWLPSACRFEPSCSAYAHEAILRHGAWRGTGLAVWRLLRCQPFCRGGYDPVPDLPPGGHCCQPATCPHPDRDQR